MKEKLRFEVGLDKQLMKDLVKCAEKERMTKTGMARTLIYEGTKTRLNK